MKKIIFFLALILIGCSDKSGVIPVNDSQEKTILGFPFIIALPSTAVLSEVKEDYFRGSNWLGVKIESDEENTDPLTKMTKLDFFFFWFKQIVDYNSSQEFLDASCGEDLSSQKYEITKSWNQNGIDFSRVRTRSMDCPVNSIGTGQAIFLDYNGKLFIIELPNGDWGSDSSKLFEIAVGSIRPIK